MQNSVQISGNTFNPYTVIKLELKGTKDTRTATDAISILFSELDIPPLGVQLSTLD